MRLGEAGQARESSNQAAPAALGHQLSIFAFIER